MGCIINGSSKVVNEPHQLNQMSDGNIKNYRFQMIRNEKHLAQQPIPKTSKLYQLALTYSYTNDYVTIQNELKNEGKNYRDLEFPPISQSIGKKGSKNIPKLDSIIWIRPRFLEGWSQINLFQDKIEPEDIQQGSLGDCYFLGALGCLAEREHLIQRIFDTDSYCEEGIYSVCLFKQGQLTQLLIDDYFPCDFKTKQPVFSKANGHELWVLLLEKAYAKLYKSYQNIVAGYPYLAINDLTGSPYDDYEVKDKTVDEIWQFLSNNFSKGFILAACSQPNKDDNSNTVNEQGIVNNHAYSLLNVKPIQYNGNTVRLINLRNPWGYTEWTGDWGDKSDKWTEEVKRQVNYVDSDNGSFWISVEDLCKNFTDVCANFLHPFYYQNSIEVDLFSKQPHIKYPAQIIQFEITKDNTHAYIQFHQPDYRSFLAQKDTFLYQRVTLCLFSAEYNSSQQKFKIDKYIDHKMSFSRDGYLECNLKKGKYCIIIGSDQKCQLQKQLVVSTYSNEPIYLQLLDLTSQQIYSFIKDSFFLIPVKDDQDLEIINEENPLVKCIEMVKFGVIFYIYENKEEKVTFLKVFTFKENNTLDLCEPYDRSQFSFEIFVPPQQRQVFAFVQKNDAVNYEYRDYFIESDDALIELTRQTPEQKDVRVIDGKEVKITSSLYWFSCGLFLLYENNESFEYQETLTLKATNLKIINEKLDISQPIHVSLQPSSIKYYIFYFQNHELDSNFDYSWKQIVE